MNDLTQGQHGKLEQLCNNGAFTQALNLTQTLLAINPNDRVAELYQLLVNIILYGPQTFESAVDRLSWHIDMTDLDRNLVRKILRICYDAAESEQDHARA
ncbi:MAG: hypothetical protein FJ145_02575 [Deltaproteobacteria bacterium]|nr:hypothetical protein [Deltaproteobacteria bacterium]